MELLLLEPELLPLGLLLPPWLPLGLLLELLLLPLGLLLLLELLGVLLMLLPLLVPVWSPAPPWFWLQPATANERAAPRIRIDFFIISVLRFGSLLVFLSTPPT